MEVVEKLSTLQSFKVHELTNANEIYVFHLNLLDLTFENIQQNKKRQ